MRRAVVLSLLLSSVAVAADTVKLGDRLVGPYDVSFKPFAGAQPADRVAISELARFKREDKKWNLAFSRFELPLDQPIRDQRQPDGTTQAGYLAGVVAKLRAGDPDADVLRNEIIDLGDLRIGVINAVTHDRNLPLLMQEALIEVTPRLYYAVVMTVPIANSNAALDPAAQEAAGVFKAITDSIEKVDLSAMKRDQDERLYRARGLFAQWSRGKLLAALKPAQYMRLKRDGRDVGYVYTVEQPADALPKLGVAAGPAPDPASAAGFRVGTSTHLIGEDGKIIDTETWSFVSFDRAHEVWSTLSRINDPSDKAPAAREPWFSELGASDLNRERKFGAGLNHDDLKDYDQKSKNDKDAATPYRQVDVYKLRVTGRNKKDISPTLERDLPPFYLPQALATLLPRVVPLNNPTGYLFAVYQSEPRQLMMRYIDVLPEATVTLDGKSVRAVAVAERVGFTGQPTTHYLTQRGEYLGTKANDGKTEVIATDRETLLSLWKDAVLREPEGTK